jgi:hypothetical protein
MNPVRAALYTALSADTTLKALLSSPTAIYHRVVPQGAGLPAVVLSKMAGTPEWMFDSAHIQTDVWLIKGIAKGSSSSPAETIAARVDLLLTDAVLAVTGRILLGIYRELDVDYEEISAGEIYHHVGAQFRVVTQPA